LDDKCFVNHHEGYSTGYTTPKLYEMFMEEFKEFKLEYRKLGNKITEEYDELKKDFLLKTQNAFSEVENINDIINELEQSYPSKKEFIDSFNISIDLFPLSNANPSQEHVIQLLVLALGKAFDIGKLWAHYEEKAYNNEIVNEMLVGIEYFEESVENGLRKGVRAESYIRDIKEDSVKLAVQHDVLDRIAL